MALRDFAALFALAAMWGASFLFIRVCVPTLGPFVTVDSRVWIAAVLLSAIALLTRKRVRLFTHWRQFLLLGLFNAAIPFALISIAELQLTASMAAILNATTPMFAALVARVWLQEALGARKWIGMAMGIVGVGILVGWSPLQLTASVVIAALCSLGAGLSYGYGGVYAARKFQGIEPLTLAIGQQIAAGLWALPLAIATWPRQSPTTPVVISILSLAIVSTAIAYILFFQLIRRVGAVKTVSVTFLVPVFGLLWGVLFLRDPVSWTTFAGLAVILLSVVFVSNIRLRPDVKAAKTP